MQLQLLAQLLLRPARQARKILRGALEHARKLVGPQVRLEAFEAHARAAHGTREPRAEAVLAAAAAR